MSGQARDYVVVVVLVVLVTVVVVVVVRVYVGLPSFCGKGTEGKGPRHTAGSKHPRETSKVVQGIWEGKEAEIRELRAES
jgi:hypothetical protein